MVVASPPSCRVALCTVGVVVPVLVARVSSTTVVVGVVDATNVVIVVVVVAVAVVVVVAVEVGVVEESSEPAVV